MTTLDRIRRTLDALGPFPARLRRPKIDVMVMALAGDGVLVAHPDLPPSGIIVDPEHLAGLPPEPPVRSPESVRVRELLAEAPRTAAELRAALRAEGLRGGAAVAVLSRCREATVVAVEVVQDASGRPRAVRRWGLTP
jgi:hypothetical protein